MLKLVEEKGNVNPKIRTIYKNKLDYNQLKEFVKENPDAFLREYAEHFNVTTVGIWSALKRLGITRKKRLQLSKKLILKNKKHSRNKLKI